jgi:nucleotide-binding universal stress UspA family protein
MSDDTLLVVCYDGSDEAKLALHEAATKIVEEGVRLGTELGLSADGVVERVTDHVWSPVVEFLDREQAAVAVVGSRRLGAIKAGVLGGFSGGLVHHSRRPVLIVPRQ